MLDSHTLTLSILRSLCAQAPGNEEAAANTNFTRLDTDAVKMTGVYLEFLTMVEQFFRFRGGPPTTKSIEDRAENLGQRELALVARDIGVQEPLWGANFVEAVEALREARSTQMLRQMIGDASIILDEGLEIQRGKPPLRGVEEAIEYMIAGAVKIQINNGKRGRVLVSDDLPERLRQEYLENQERQQSIHGATRLAKIDKVTCGARPGDLWFIGGYTSQGKTTFALNWARNLVLGGGWNVYFLTMEMQEIEVANILAASYAADPKWLRAKGLLHSEIEAGRFSNPEDDFFYRQKIIPTIFHPNEGRFILEHPTSGIRPSDVWARAEAHHRTHPLDMIIVDYIGLLRPEVGNERMNSRESTTENIRFMKRMALEFSLGAGIPVVSPWQISRDGYDEAKKNEGRYEMRAFADTAEVERSADQLLTIFRDEELESREEALICHLKNRRGPTAPPFRAYAPFQYRWLSDTRVPKLNLR